MRMARPDALTVSTAGMSEVFSATALRPAVASGACWEMRWASVRIEAARCLEVPAARHAADSRSRNDFRDFYGALRDAPDVHSAVAKLKIVGRDLKLASGKLEEPVADLIERPL